MKKLIIVLFSFICHTCYAQSVLTYYIDFDNGYTYNQVNSVFIPDTQSANYNSLIIIDTINYHRNQWQIGKPAKVIFNSAYSIPNAIITDTALSCISSDTSVFILKLPKAAWLDMENFSFKYQLDIDSGDIALFEMSVDTGMHWINVLSDTNNYFYINDSNNFSHSTVGWKDFLMYSNFTQYQQIDVDTLLFRFTLFTDSNTNQRDGWMIDNFIIGYEGEGVANINKGKGLLNVYPNPTDSKLNISYSNIIKSIMINNFAGQVIYDEKNWNKKVVQINTINFPSGLYYIKVNNQEYGIFIKD